MSAPAPAAARATLSQVAERAGVSLKTASRALSGESYVSDDKRARVIQAAADLGYQRNAAASLLASGRLADSIGLITGDFTNPFYSALAQAVEDVVRPRGIHLSVANAGESSEQEWRIATDLADRQSLALLVVSASANHAAYSALIDRGIPVVFVDRPPTGIAADSVVFDNRDGGRLAAQHLRGAGHERIAFIGDYSWLPTTRERVRGMIDVLGEDCLLQRTDAHDVASARACAAQLLADGEAPTAIVAGNNRALLGIMEHVTRLPVESQPAVIGFDDVEWAGMLGITVVTGDTAALGRQAAELALERLSDRTRSPKRVLLPMRLIERSSVTEAD